MSHNFEDIIYVIDKEVQNFLKGMGEEILSHSSRNEIIECHLNPYIAAERRNLVIEKLEQIVEIS